MSSLIDPTGWNIQSSGAETITQSVIPAETVDREMAKQQAKLLSNFWSETEMPFTPVVSDEQPAVRVLHKDVSPTIENIVTGNTKYTPMEQDTFPSGATLITEISNKGGTLTGRSIAGPSSHSGEQVEALAKVGEAINSEIPTLLVGAVMAGMVPGPLGAALVHEMGCLTNAPVLDIDLSRLKNPQIVEKLMLKGQKEGDLILLENPDKASSEMLQRVADVANRKPENKWSRVFAATTGEQNVQIDGFRTVDVSKKTIQHNMIEGYRYNPEWTQSKGEKPFASE